LFERDVPESALRTALLARLERLLDPAKPLDGEGEMAKRWIELQGASPKPDIYDEKLAGMWRGLGCASDGAPFVLMGLVATMSNPYSTPFAQNSVQASKLAADFLKEDCAGARGTSAETRAALIKLRDAAPRASAQPNAQPAKP
jgi:hypothetical protein